jgi:hypothetical protein
MMKETLPELIPLNWNMASKIPGFSTFTHFSYMEHQMLILLISMIELLLSVNTWQI